MADHIFCVGRHAVRTLRDDLCDVASLIVGDVAQDGEDGEPSQDGRARVEETDGEHIPASSTTAKSWTLAKTTTPQIQGRIQESNVLGLHAKGGQLWGQC